MEKKTVARIIQIDSYRDGIGVPPPPPQPASTIRNIRFSGNQGTSASVLRMFRIWCGKVARFHRVPVASVEQRVLDELLEERYRRAA